MPRPPTSPISTPPTHPSASCTAHSPRHGSIRPDLDLDHGRLDGKRDQVRRGNAHLVADADAELQRAGEDGGFEVRAAVVDVVAEQVAFFFQLGGKNC